MINQTEDLLVIIDPQNDFCEGGALAVKGADTAFIRKIGTFASKFKNVVISQDWHPAGHSSFASSHEGAEPFTQIDKPYGKDTLWPDHCVQNTGGADIHPALNPGIAQAVIRKGYNPAIDSYSAFFENDHVTPTGLGGYVTERGFKRVIFVGLAYDFCVAYSAIDARKIKVGAKGSRKKIPLESVVIEDLCRAIDNGGSLEGANAAMTAAGVVVTTSDLI